jgi:hypothetical protein
LDCERITSAWAEGLKERLNDAKTVKRDDCCDYDSEIELACFYARKAQTYKDMAVWMGNDLKEYLKSNKADAVSREFVSAIESIKLISERYETMSSEIWNGFEKKAIHENQDEEPFYNLLGAIYGGMVDEYRSCVDTICNTNNSVEKRDHACSSYIYFEGFFKNTAAEPILHSEIRNPGLLDRCVESFKWRRGKEKP